MTLPSITIVDGTLGEPPPGGDPPDDGDWFDAPTPSDLAYPPWIRAELQRAEARMRPRILAIADRYYKAKADQRTLAVFRHQLDAVAEMEIPRGIKRYVEVELHPTTYVVHVHLAVPLYKHDCDVCTYLGRLVDRPTEADTPRWFDLYFCDKQATGRTFIARFGDEGPDYNSGSAPYSYPLAAARRRVLLMESR